MLLAYKCCSHILNGLHFTRTGVRFCNKLSSIGQDNIVPYEKDFYKKFIEIKKGNKEALDSLIQNLQGIKAIYN